MREKKGGSKGGRKRKRGKGMGKGRKGIEAGKNSQKG